MMSFLTYDPEMRITAEEALEHPYFRYAKFLDNGNGLDFRF